MSTKKVRLKENNAIVTNKEKLKEIKEDLQNLKGLGVDVYCVTCDGHSAILKAVAKVYPNAVIQRCLAHIKRQVHNFLSESQVRISQGINHYLTENYLHQKYRAG